MSILRDIFNRIVGAPVPTTGAPPATPTTHEPLATTTVAALRAMLDEHDRGVFRRSALLADLMRRDDAVFGALQQRLGLQASYPTLVDPADAAPVAAADADALRADLPRMCPAGVATDMWTDEALLGFGLAQVVWEPGPGGILRQRMEPVHGAAVEHDRPEARWYVHTLDQGRIPITPGDGQWVLFAPSSHRAPWLWGAVRPCAEWWLSNSNVASDGRRRSETTGQGIYKAKLPAGARQTPDGTGFIRSLRNIGRAAVIPVPQGATPESSYDVELIEAQVDAYKIFEWLRRTGGGAVRLAILGQDLTSQNNTVGTNASSETGADVLRTITRSRARAWGETLTAQVAGPRARYLGCTRSIVRVDAEPKADRKAEAEAQTAAADAVIAWQNLGFDVDVQAVAVAAGMPQSETPAARSEPTAQIFAWHITTGVVTPDEARARLGLDPLPNGAGSKPTPTDLPIGPDPATLSARRLADVDLSPPKGVREACARGVELYEEGLGGDGLVDATVDWARRLARGEDATRDKLVKMRAWHARHEGDKTDGWDSPPTPGYVAFMLWGGDPGRSWAETMVPRLEGEDLSARRLAAKALPSQEEIARRLSDLLRAHVGDRAPDIIAALRGSTDPASARKALAGVMDTPPPAALVREVAGYMVLARLAGDASARK